MVAKSTAVAPPGSRYSYHAFSDRQIEKRLDVTCVTRGAFCGHDNIVILSFRNDVAAAPSDRSKSDRSSRNCHMNGVCMTAVGSQASRSITSVAIVAMGCVTENTASEETTWTRLRRSREVERGSPVRPIPRSAAPRS